LDAKSKVLFLSLQEGRKEKKHAQKGRSQGRGIGRQASCRHVWGARCEAEVRGRGRGRGRGRAGMGWRGWEAYEDGAEAVVKSGIGNEIKELCERCDPTHTESVFPVGPSRNRTDASQLIAPWSRARARAGW
jgi:hypothetical protein